MSSERVRCSSLHARSTSLTIFLGKEIERIVLLVVGIRVLQINNHCYPYSIIQRPPVKSTWFLAQNGGGTHESLLHRFSNDRSSGIFSYHVLAWRRLL